MKQYKTEEISSDELSLINKIRVGAAVLSLAFSFSTHHVTTGGKDMYHAMTQAQSIAEIGHLFEREREVMHPHVSYGRVRYPHVSGDGAV